MPSKRKTASQAKMASKRPSQVASSSSSPTANTLIELSEEEQMRLINQSGILKKVDEANSETVEYVEEKLPLAEEILNALLYIIPSSFLLMLMEILIHQQYQQIASLQAILDRMIPGVPILSVFVFYTLRYKSYRRMQLFLFFVAVLASSRLIYLFNKAAFMVNMKQAPPLATLWIYCVVQLDLGPAILSLLGTGGFVWWKDLKFSF